MIEHSWSIMCKTSIVDQDTNLISIIDVFEGFNLDMMKLPDDKNIALPLEFEIVSMLRKNNLDVEARAELKLISLDPSGKKLGEPTLAKITIPKDKFNIRHRFKNFGFKITTEGVYRFIVQIKQEKQATFREVCSIPISINDTSGEELKNDKRASKTLVSPPK